MFTLTLNPFSQLLYNDLVDLAQHVQINIFAQQDPMMGDFPDTLWNIGLIQNAQKHKVYHSYHLLY